MQNTTLAMKTILSKKSKKPPILYLKHFRHFMFYFSVALAFLQVAVAEIYPAPTGGSESELSQTFSRVWKNF